jgi:hypothetical protein
MENWSSIFWDIRPCSQLKFNGVISQKTVLFIARAEEMIAYNCVYTYSRRNGKA